MVHCRTMQTAVGVFGGEAYTDGVNVPPLMVANTGNSGHPAISSLNCPPFVAVELCREHLVCHITYNGYCRALFCMYIGMNVYKVIAFVIYILVLIQLLTRSESKLWQMIVPPLFSH